ncbi:MAG: hypothetical protein ACXWKC_18265 [Xanthobacteraceae bacterium]
MTFVKFATVIVRGHRPILRSVLIGFAFILAFLNPGWASVLSGTTVSGYLVFPISASNQNWWDPNSAAPQNPLFVPAPYLNHSGSTTVTISATDPEFGWCACGASHTSVVADFTDTALKVTSFSDFSLGLGWVQTFTDSAFAGLSVSKILDQYPYNDGVPHPDNGVTASLVGDVLTLTWSGATKGCPDCANVGPYEADFSFSPAASAAPVPAALPLFVSGLGAMGLLGWRRKRKITRPTT